MRRHLVEHDDFEVFIATNGGIQDDIPHLKIERPAWLARLGRTRLWRLVQNVEMILSSSCLNKDLLSLAKEFQPDAILTVADLTLSESARKLSIILDLPLLVNFQDWWPRGQFYYPQERPYSVLVPLFERRFRRMHRSADLVFCTSEGMRKFLGVHSNSHVLYPIGARKSSDSPTAFEVEAYKSHGKLPKKQLIYTGTAFGSYGRMLRALAEELKDSDEWELTIFGATPDWSEEEVEQAKVSGLYQGFLPFEQLKAKLRQADACLSVMSFDPKLETMMRTSFTTKVLDYCSA
ncbi:MAG: glycosyltransferase, partial [Cyanobacteria bacterium P01_H01_bin.15]